VITSAEIKKIAALSRLYVADEEIEALAADMSDIVAFADQIVSAEVSEAPPESGKGLEALRADESTAAPPRADILSNATTSDGEYFVLEVRKRG
jgi:aspartyl-tRNA(Asn)/glutamyl-tRNA(Gln) amidotransferase subunit C